MVKKIAVLLLIIFSVTACGPSKSTKKTTENKEKKTKRRMIVDEGDSDSPTPSWFNSPPKGSGTYYFAGVGKGKSRRGAKNAALADIFSQIVYMVNASITSNSTFESYVEENEEEARRNSSVYKKVKAKGDAVIENFEMDKQKVETERVKGKKKYVFYALAKIPKSEIKKARERAEAQRAKMKKNPLGVFSYAVFPSGNVMELDTIKSELQGLYKNMGYNVKTVALDIDAKTAKSAGKLVKFLKNETTSITKAIVCIMKSSGLRRERMGKFKVTSIKGDLIIREIDLKTGEIISTNTLSSKGVSMRKGSDAPEDAFRKLIKNLTKELLGDEDGGSEEEDF